MPVPGVIRDAPEHLDALVIGAGPAGLRAAEELVAAGRRVVVAEARPSVGRKFLMAGKSGLNLTKADGREAVLSAYGAAAPRLAPFLADCGPEEISAWAEGLGQTLFTGSSGRVFPEAMKASPLLRAWLARLAPAAEIRTRWRWTGFEGSAALFETPAGPARIAARATILALGGASWSRLGSDGAWAGALAAEGVSLAPFRPSNGGLDVAWTPHMARHFGAPLKAIALTAGGATHRGECVVTAKGLEGGGVYAVFAAVRDGAALTLDLVPDLPEEAVARRLARRRGKATRAEHLRKALKLDPVKRALLQEFARPLPPPETLAPLLKALPVRHRGPRPLDEAISTAGGIRWEGLTPDLELRARPGTYAAGEMLDWEAPTGGYLLTACLATGRRAGRAAARALDQA